MNVNWVYTASVGSLTSVRSRERGMRLQAVIAASALVAMVWVARPHLIRAALVVRIRRRVLKVQSLAHHAAVARALGGKFALHMDGSTQVSVRYAERLRVLRQIQRHALFALEHARSEVDELLLALYEHRHRTDGGGALAAKGSRSRWDVL